MTEPKPRDWPAIRREYETNPLSIRGIARMFDMPESTLRRRASIGGWERPESAKTRPVAAPLTEEERDAAALARQRGDVRALVALFNKLQAGLERIVDGEPKDQDTKLLGKTGSAIDAFSALAGAQTRLIQLLRQAQTLDADPEGAQSLAEKLRAAQREMDAATRGTPADGTDKTGPRI